MAHDRIALDVMGGDHAPLAVLEGALLAVRPESEGGKGLPPERLLLVGEETTLREGLAQLDANAPDFAILHASQTIGMDESPATALRAKPDSSIAKCVGAVLQGGAGAVCSMGNTGAVVGASTLGLKTLSGVKRPAIAVTLDLTGRPLTLLDMGANIAPKPEHLVQNAIMAAAYVRSVLGIQGPRVGLMNVGEEKSKGTDLLKQTHALLAEQGGSDFVFVGNLEGGDLFHEKADIVVTDGFTGNVILKLLEHFAGFMMKLMMGELGKHPLLREHGDWADEALVPVKKAIDYSEYGGALLLGVSGVVVIGHGRSDARAVANALGLAASALDGDVNGDIVSGLESSSLS